MLVLGPRTSWKLWNTHREELLRRKYSSAKTKNVARTLSHREKCWMQAPLPTAKELEEACRWSGEMVDIFLQKPTRAYLPGVSKICYHKLTFPRHALLALSRDVYCLTPEYLFVRFCARADKLSALQFGMSICSTFNIREDETLYNQPPVCSVAEVQKLCSEAVGYYGVKHAQWCSKYIADGSASPREMVLYLLLRLPMYLGGYGLSGAQCNYPVRIGQNVNGDSEVLRFADLCWPEERVCVEYDSTVYHALEEKIAADSARRSEFLKLGYTVVSITNNEINDLGCFRKSAHVISKLLGKRVPVSPVFLKKNYQLYTRLLRSELGEWI